MNDIRVLVAARHVPDYSTVTKRGGEKEYEIRRKFTLYRVDGKEEIHPAEGCVFLCAGSGVNEIVDTTLVLVEPENLSDYLEPYPMVACLQQLQLAIAMRNRNEIVTIAPGDIFLSGRVISKSDLGNLLQEALDESLEEHDNAIND